MPSRANTGSGRAGRHRRDRDQVSGVPAARPPRQRRGRDPPPEGVCARRAAAALPRRDLLCPLRRAAPRGLCVATATNLQARRLRHPKSVVPKRSLRTQAGCKGLTEHRRSHRPAQGLDELHERRYESHSEPLATVGGLQLLRLAARLAAFERPNSAHLNPTAACGARQVAIRPSDLDRMRRARDRRRNSAALRGARSVGPLYRPKVRNLN